MATKTPKSARNAASKTPGTARKAAIQRTVAAQRAIQRDVDAKRGVRPTRAKRSAGTGTGTGTASAPAKAAKPSPRRARATPVAGSAKPASTRSSAAKAAPASSGAAKGAARKDASVKSAPGKGGGKSTAKPPVQAGTRRQPQNPLPAQHLRKPGYEHELDPQPRFLAPDYRGSGKLQGMAAIVTGGDSGIGRAVAVLFAREGADVTVTYLSEHDDAAETAARVEAEGRRCLLVAGDIKQPGFCEQVVRQTLDAFGRLDVLVNNAAFQQHVESIGDISDAQWDETVQTNIGGYFRMARAAVPHMKRGGAIINTGSETGLFGSKHLLDYSATKGAIHAFTLSLASNLLERGIRVNAVAPGPVWTPLNPADQPPDKVAQFGQSSDMGRPAQPEEVSPAFVFLAAPACSSYISGIVLPVMGGPHG